MGRPARGVKAITLADGDEVVAMDVVEDERKEVLIVTSHAFGKRTPIDDYRHTARGGKGVKAFAKEKEIGHVVDQILVKPEDELLLITSGNQVIRIPRLRDPPRRPLDQGRPPAAAGRRRRGHRDREPGRPDQARRRHHRRGTPGGLAAATLRRDRGERPVPVRVPAFSTVAAAAVKPARPRRRPRRARTAARAAGRARARRTLGNRSLGRNRRLRGGSQGGQ